MVRSIPHQQKSLKSQVTCALEFFPTIQKLFTTLWNVFYPLELPGPNLLLALSQTHTRTLHLSPYPPPLSFSLYLSFSLPLSLSLLSSLSIYLSRSLSSFFFVYLSSCSLSSCLSLFLSLSLSRSLRLSVSRFLFL